MINFSEKQLNDIQITLGLQTIDWGSLIEDAEYNKDYGAAEHYEAKILMGMQINTKLRHGDTDLSKEELELLIHLYEECIESNETRNDVTEAQKKEMVDEEKDILKLLRTAYN